ncbi:MAG: WecB/TagA/CpsF family glycosyltransferase [Terracidiphilus sp.]
MTASAEPERLLATRCILGVKVAVSSYEDVVHRSLFWARLRLSRAQLFANVHVVMEAVDDPDFLRLLNTADVVNPDGMPLVWALRALGESKARQVCGPDATLALLEAAECAGVPVGFYGGTQAILDTLSNVIRLRYPNLLLAYIESPPFRALTPEEDAAVVDRIVTSGARLLFVGIGCPKQERWIVEHLGRVPAVMFAVGAAFDFIAGSKRRAPRWMSRCGLEWLFRFILEPRRLARRYLKHNPRFIFKFLRQLLSGNR